MSNGASHHTPAPLADDLKRIAAASLSLSEADCAAPYLLLQTEEPRVTYRVRVRRSGQDDEALVDCE